MTESTSLVLSGGAAQGSFEIGALDFMYGRGFVANAICSTSVGSVNGLLLAHDGTGPGQAARFGMLKAIWATELNSNADMCDEAPWLAGVTPTTRAAIDRLFSGEIDVPSLAASAIFFPPYAIGQAIALGTDLADALIALGHASSVFTLAPTRAKIEKNLHPNSVANSGVELRMVAVSLDSGAIRYITQDGRVIETDGRKVPGPNPRVCTVERNAYNSAMAAKTAAGHAVSTAQPQDRMEAIAEYKAASDAADRAKAALDACVSQAVANGAGDQLTVSVADGAIASSSIPCVFPPTVLGDEAYVDGGIRWTLPLLTAIDLDPERIVAVSTSPAAIPAPAQGFEYRNASILDIAERSVLGLELFETQDQHVHAARLEAAKRRQQVLGHFPALRRARRLHRRSRPDRHQHRLRAHVRRGRADRLRIPDAGTWSATSDPTSRSRSSARSVHHRDPIRRSWTRRPTRRGARSRMPSPAAAGNVGTSSTTCSQRSVPACSSRRGTSWWRCRISTPWASCAFARRCSGCWCRCGTTSAQACRPMRSRGRTGGSATSGQSPSIQLRQHPVGRLPERRPDVACGHPAQRRGGQGAGPAGGWLLNPTRHWITSPDVLMRFGGWAMVEREIPDWYLDALPRGEDITSTSQRPGDWADDPARCKRTNSAPSIASQQASTARL